VNLPQGWTAVSGERGRQLEQELRREIPRTHRLHGVVVEAVATHDADNDDVLFRGAGGEGVFCVHLTWNVERDSMWPHTQAFENVADFTSHWSADAM
jgi:hypothetical protein